MPDLKFNFTCFALCVVEFEEGEQPQAHIEGGFYASREDCERGEDGIELARRGEWDAQAEKYPTITIYSRSRFKRQHYEIVPLCDCVFASLDELERKVCAAAVLMAAGVAREK